MTDPIIVMERQITMCLWSQSGLKWPRRRGPNIHQTQIIVRCELHFSMMQPTPMALGGQPQVMVMASSQPANQLESYNGRAVVALGITQIIIGVLCITFQVIFFFTRSHLKSYAEGIGHICFSKYKWRIWSLMYVTRAKCPQKKSRYSLRPLKKAVD